MTEAHQKSEEASADAIEKTRLAQEAIEASRKAQAEESEEKHLKRMVEALKIVFPENLHDEDRELQIYLPRVPLICGEIKSMKFDITNIASDMSDMKDGQKYISRALTTAIITLITSGLIVLFSYLVNHH